MGRKKAKRFSIILGYKNVLKLNYNGQNFAELENFLKSGVENRSKERGVKVENLKNIKNKPVELILELGCGKGEHIVYLSQKYTECVCVGVDLKGDRIYIGSTEAIEKNLQNCLFVQTRVEDFLKNLEILVKNGSFQVKDVWITFPDPQPNNLKKSLVSARYRVLMEKILNDKTTISLKTDSALVFEHFKENYKDFQKCEHEILPVTSAFENKFNALGVCTKHIKVKPGKGFNTCG